jgi:hypothetical protein
MPGQGGALAEGLPRALRRAVALDRVPGDIKPDLLFLARLLDPLAARLKALAPDLPAKARQARQQLEPQADKAFEVHPPLLLHGLCCQGMTMLESQASYC